MNINYTHVIIGYFRMDGNFQVLATMNNGASNLEQTAFNVLVDETLEIYRDRLGTDVMIIERQGAPDMIRAEITDREHVEDPDDSECTTNREYLRGLAERLRKIPVVYGTDDGDIDRLLEISDQL